jgi:hypothetical protein
MFSAWFVTLALLSAQSVAAQDPHAGIHARGATVMGFDQHKTAHHFYLFEDGGAIDIAVKDAADTANRDAIRAHLPHIAMMFGAGNFEAPMLIHDTRTVPGMAGLVKLKERIVYRYTVTPKGGRVDITTTDPAALTAVHEFLRYQITEHQTGDAKTVTRRASGN